MQRSEDAHQDLVQECSIVLQRYLTKALKDARKDLESYLFHPYIGLEQVSDDLLDVGQLLSCLVRILADKGVQEHTKRWNQVLHLTAPVGLN